MTIQSGSGKIAPTDVFTPGSKPTVTYYDRAKLKLESKLLEALETKGFITSVSGPSKSGKTVLCENVVGQKKMLLIPGGGIETIDAFWSRIREKIGLPQEISITTGSTSSGATAIEAKGGYSIPLVFQASGAVTGTITDAKSTTSQTKESTAQGLKLLGTLKEMGFTLVVDDFHYVNVDVRRQLAEIFKEAARDGLSIVVVAVSHRADDAIRANPDLRGRVCVLDIPKWDNEELQEIATLGFPRLGLTITPNTLASLVAESIGSPQLMQALCLKLCRQIGWSQDFKSAVPIDLSAIDIGTLLKDTSSLTDCRTAFEALATGPRIRGEDRKEFPFSDGTNGDVYIAILKAIASGEPSLTISYDTLKERIEKICPKEKPRGVALDRALEKMKNITDEKLNKDRVFDWNENHINLPDPYFLYYLRWATWPNVN